MKSEPELRGKIRSPYPQSPKLIHTTISTYRIALIFNHPYNHTPVFAYITLMYVASFTFLY